MNLQKRIFATNHTLDYKDVYSLKNGTEILNAVKRENNHAVLNQYRNYQQLNTLHSAYFPLLDNNIIIVENVTNLYNANESFVDLAPSSGNHHSTSDCTSCKRIPVNPTTKDCWEHCRQSSSLKGRGQLLSKKRAVPYDSAVSTMYLCNWNNCSKTRPENPFSRCHCTKPSNRCHCSTHSCSLCKNTKPLFI